MTNARLRLRGKLSFSVMQFSNRWIRIPSFFRYALGAILAFSAPFCPAEWQTALPGWTYVFPRDHGNHPGFKTEWWYFTGNLVSPDGRAFGYQLTFFRQGVGSNFEPSESRFVTRDIKLAHFAVTDKAADSFLFFQKVSRGAYGEAGFADGHRLAWIDDWSCELLPSLAVDGRAVRDRFRIRARVDAVALDLTLTAVKPPVIHGSDGVSQKAAGAGRASHYYSLTRLLSEGTLTLNNAEVSVSGLSWFDHEWATNQLAKNQVGWDWFSLQFVDGSELMLFQLRNEAGEPDPFSAGTFIAASGETIAVVDFVLTPTKFWRNQDRTGNYPVAWRIEIPKLDLDLQVTATKEDQELRLQPVVYWEGAVRAKGTRKGLSLEASGYLEMTGYAGSVPGMVEGR